jgi:hypothetical protein
MGSPQPLQLPLAVDGRRGGGLLAGVFDRGGMGERRPPRIAGSIGDSGESINGSSGRIGFANCSLGECCELSTGSDAFMSSINLSMFDVSDSFLWSLGFGGLDRELAMLFSLYAEASEDWEVEGV